MGSLYKPRPGEQWARKSGATKICKEPRINQVKTEWEGENQFDTLEEEKDWIVMERLGLSEGCFLHWESSMFVLHFHP